MYLKSKIDGLSSNQHKNHYVGRRHSWNHYNYDCSLAFF